MAPPLSRCRGNQGACSAGGLSPIPLTPIRAGLSRGGGRWLCKLDAPRPVLWCPLRVRVVSAAPCRACGCSGLRRAGGVTPRGVWYAPRLPGGSAIAGGVAGAPVVLPLGQCDPSRSLSRTNVVNRLTVTAHQTAAFDRCVSSHHSILRLSLVSEVLCRYCSRPSHTRPAAQIS